MKRLVFAALLFLASLSPALAQYYPEGFVFTAAAVTNPAANAVIVDSGPISGNTLGFSGTFKVICSTTSTALVRYWIEVRDATDTTTRVQLFFTGQPTSTAIYDGTPIGFKFFQDERLRVIAQAAITGIVKCEILVGIWQYY